MLNIFYSQTLSACETEIFNSIKKNRGENFKHVIFTPDRRTLITEQKLFEAIGSNCFFDIDVITLTRYTSKILSKNNLDYKVLTKPLGVTLIKKILTEHEKEFKTFKKAVKFNGFSATLFDTICMFKSCGVSPENISDNYKSASLNLKLSDIKLVYSEYENFLKNEWTDSFNKLNLLNKLLTREECENTFYYFIGFDDFTPQMYEIIKKFSLFAKNVNIATAVNYIDECNNKNLYLNNVYLNLLNLATTNGLNFKKFYCPTKLSETNKFLANNLFSFKQVIKVDSNNKVHCYKFNNINDEINFATKYILNLCLKGAKFSDFAILVSDLAAYKTGLKNCLMKNNVPCFFDEAEPVVNNIILRFYFDLFSLINNNFNKTELINFLRSYTTISRSELTEFQNYIMLRGINYNKFFNIVDIDMFENVIHYLKIIKNFTIKLNGGQHFSDFLSELLTFTKDFGFNEYINSLSTNFINDNNILEHQKLIQISSKVNDGFKLLSEVLGNYETTTANCFNIIKAYFENLTVVIPPIVANSVFVGDILTSFVNDKKYAIILGAAEGKMPIVQSDLGLISDNEILTLSKDMKLTPTINIINKRNKFKLYETVVGFQNLLVSYVCLNNSGESIMPSELIKNLTDFFEPKVNLINGSVLQQISEYELLDNNLLFNNPTNEFVKQNLLIGIKNYEIENDNSNYLHSISVLFNSVSDNSEITKLVNNYNYKNEVKNINCAVKLFFKNDTLSVSQFENYFNCPYKHFVDYGLKLKNAEQSEFTAIEIGNVLHEYVKQIVPVIESNLNIENINVFINETGSTIIKRILEQDKYKYLLNNELNVNAVKSLTAEVLRINDALIKISLKSKFRTKKDLLEYEFITNDILKIGNVSFKLKGFIDRIDVNDNELRVIDYKTGNSEFNDFTDIYSGKKLQLIIYAYIAGNKLNAKPVGAFYLPLKNDFVKNEKTELFKLKGIIENNLATIINMDEDLINNSVKSEILNLRKTENGEIKGGILVETTEMQTLIQYALKLINKALLKINFGNISPEPLKVGETVPCEYCAYFGMCKFSESFGNNFREVKKVKSVKDLEEGNE